MYHLWRDWFLPWETLRTVLAQPWLDLSWALWFQHLWTGMYAVDTRMLDAPLFMRPQGERMVSYSVLARLEKREVASRLAGHLREIDRALVELGGKAYLSGHVDYGREEWEEHYEENFELGARWKREFDPNGVFQWQGMPFEENPVASHR